MNSTQVISACIKDDALAYRLAVGASEILKGVRNVDLLHGRILEDVSNTLAQGWIARVLEQHRPDDGLLPREAADNREHLDSKRVWIIDLLDGTRESASGRQDWAVHVALIEDGQPTHTAVGPSGHGQVFHTSGAEAVQRPRTSKIVVSRTRPPAMAKYAADRLDMGLIEMGSAGAEAMRVLLDDFDVHIHDGGQYEWDSAVPVGVAKSARLFASRLDGSAPTYNNVDTFLPDILFCRPDLSEGILTAVKEFKDQEQRQVSQGGYDRFHWHHNTGSSGR